MKAKELAERLRKLPENEPILIQVYVPKDKSYYVQDINGVEVCLISGKKKILKCDIPDPCWAVWALY